MFLVGENVLNLDSTISTYLPELKNSNKSDVTLREILTHQAGLFPFIPFWRNTLEHESNDALSAYYYQDHPNNHFSLKVTEDLYAAHFMPDSIWKWLVDYKQLTPEKKSNTYAYRYSDVGYYLMKRLVEKKTNQKMEVFLEQNFYKPLGMTSTCFNPLTKFPIDSIAPTENDLYFRKAQVHGTVHDQGSAMMGGVAGHAGLFTNGYDLVKLLQMNLDGGVYAGKHYLNYEVLDEFTKAQFEGNRRGLGWDKPEPAGYGPSGERASSSAFGHSGFTGTIVWVDPDYDLIYVFLSNRVFPDAENRKLLTQDIRTRIHDVIYMSIMNFDGDLVN